MSHDPTSGEQHQTFLAGETPLSRPLNHPNALPASGDAPDVWLTDTEPGGYGCGGHQTDGTICGVPTESEPCPRHQSAAYRAID